jgi:uncharacterized membrane protein YgcG
MRSSEIFLIALIVVGVVIVPLLVMTVKRVRSSGSFDDLQDGTDHTTQNPIFDPNLYLSNNPGLTDSAPPDQDHPSHRHHHHHHAQPDSSIGNDPGSSHHGGFDSGSHHGGFDSSGHSGGGFDGGGGHH